jgi:ankyrin repeat protein
LKINKILGKTAAHNSTPKCSMYEKDENGNGPLHIAAKAGNPILVRPLIESKAKLNSKNNLGKFYRRKFFSNLKAS